MKTLSLKVAIGYIVIISLFIGATYYINHQATIFISSNLAEDSIYARRANCDQLMSLILKAEALGQTASIGDKESLNKYSSSLNLIDSAISSLNTLSTDSFKLLLDSLSTTIHYKASIVKRLYDISTKTTSSAYQQQVEELISQYSNISNQSKIITTIIKEEKSVAIEKSKKNVFQRIAAVFKPGDSDTTIISNTATSHSDTISSYEAKGEQLKSDFNKINTNAIRQKTQHFNLLQSNINILRLEGSNLGLKISSLINNIEQSEQRLRESQIDNERKIRRKSIFTTIIIAILATTIALIFLVIIWRDITRSNRYRKELEIARKKAEDLLIAREKLMLTITHDIKAPAGAIKGYSELINQSQHTANISDYVQSINDSASHLLNLVGALLDYHKLENNDIEITSSDFNIATSLENIAKTFIPVANKKRLTIDLNLHPSTHCVINSDEFRLRQIIENLISNAIKFTDNGGISISSNIIGDRLNISIADTGKGIDPEEEKIIFNEFARLKNARGIEGSGLGLSIVAKLVSLLDGEITLSSQPSKGSTFSISIPITISESYPSLIGDNIQNGTLENVSISLTQCLNILIIDDDPIQLKYTKSILHNINNQWLTTCCSTAEEGLNMARSINPNIIFTDINMPHIDGIELMQQLKLILPSIPIIALTANCDIDKYTSIGFDGVLSKPYNKKQLIETLQNFVPTNEIDLSGITQFADDDEETKTLLLTTALDETIKNGEAITNAIIVKNKPITCSIAHKMLPLISMVKIQGIDAFEHFNNQRDCNTWNDDDNAHAQVILKTIDRLISHLKSHTNHKKD